MENLNDALKDLRDRITEDGFVTGLVEKVARDWDLKAALLDRKFAEKYGVAASEYRALTKTALRNLAIEIAMKSAVSFSERFTGGADVLGKSFKDTDGEEFIAVAIAVGGLRAVKVSNGAWMVFGKSGADAIALATKFGLV